MEIAQLCKGTYNNQLEQSISLSYAKHVSNVAGEHTLAKPKYKVTP